MVEVKKKDHESVEGLLRRFKKKVQQSGILYRARNRRYYERPKNRRQRREDALKRKELREEKEYLRKIGKLDTTTRH